MAFKGRLIKPALVGLTGPWISGGIEFNWPQHHRPSTFLPVDWKIQENADGSATVWVSEQERMFHQKGSAKFTLHPGRAYIEIEGSAQNPTPFPQTFLWWANPAVYVGDEYQSVFPPDVNAVFDHGKRDVSTFPIATGTYYKVDYSSGVDISRYRNIPVPTSYMAIESKYDFVGGYENDTQAGVLHVANHHVSPGKKQWTWGNGDFGVAWDRNLTDEDGPYIELMTGMFTDNQPDFTWLQPLESKSFKQYFMPYRELGVVKNATKDIMLTESKIFATSKIEGVTVSVDGQQFVTDLSPEKVVDIPFRGKKITISKDGKMLLEWDSTADANREVPAAAQAALLPEQIDTTEQLFLTGQHLEQYRHARYNPEDYYREALRRDATDIRNNNAMGLLLIRKGRFDKAEPYLRQAIETQLKRNPNPYDGEPHYNLGQALKFQGRLDEAYKALYKSCWNSAWQDAGYYALAQISSLKGNYTEALEESAKSLNRNWNSDRTRALRSALLARTAGEREALHFIEESLELDSFNFGALVVRMILGKATAEQVVALMREDSHNYRETALDFMGAGLWSEAIATLKLAPKPNPMVYYYMAYCTEQMGETPRELLERAAAADSYCCFPNRLEDIAILRWAMRLNPKDARARYYLGNLYYDKRQYELAMELWEQSAAIEENFATVWRNLALGYFNKFDQRERAVASLEKAFSLDTADARVLMELDQLYKKINRPHAERLALLSSHFELVAQRDDLYLEYATLLNNIGEWQKAREMIDSRKFHPWEGGEGKVPSQYQFARLQLAKQAIGEGNPGQAIELLSECYDYPHNLGEGKLTGAAENDFDYYMALALEAMGEVEQAQEYLERATKGQSSPAAAIYYNDQKPDKIYYQGLALLKLGRNEEAASRFDALITYGKEHIDQSVVLDYFAVSLPDLLIWEESLDRQSRIHCLYMMGLGYLGKGEKERAAECFARASSMDTNHQGLISHK